MSYTKNSSISFPIGTTYRRKHSWESPPVVRTTGIFTASRTITGDRLPKWREVIRDGGNATTSLTAIEDSIDISGGGAGAIVQSGTTSGGRTVYDTWDGDVALSNGYHHIGEPFGTTSSSSFADNQARARFYKRLQSDTTMMQGGVFLGELRETVHMLHHPAAAIFNKTHGYLAKLKKRKQSLSRASVVALSDLWLEYRFGVVPLVLDVQDAARAYRAKYSSIPRATRISGSGKSSADTTSSLTNDWKEGFTFTLLDSEAIVRNSGVSRKDEHIVKYRGAIRSQVKAPPPRDWNELYGLTSTQFIPTLWELLPWSFLVDYFANVGDILSAAATSTNNLAYVNRTQISTCTFKYSVVPHAAGGGFGGTVKLSGHGQSFVAKRRVVSRSPNSGMSLPTFQIDFSLSSGQLANTAALLGSSLGLKRDGFDISPLFKLADSIFPQRFKFKR